MDSAATSGQQLACCMVQVFFYLQVRKLGLPLTFSLKTLAYNEKLGLPENFSLKTLAYSEKLGLPETFRLKTLAYNEKLILLK